MSGNSLAKMLGKGREAADAERDRPSSTTTTLNPNGSEKREKFGSRMLPSLQLLLGRHALDLKAQTGRRASVEALLEALVLEYRDDPELQKRVQGRLTQD